MKNKKVLVPLAKGFEEIEAVSIIDVLRRGGIDVLVAYLDEDSVVKGAHEILVQADIFIEDVEVSELDMIVLPGGWGGTNILASNKTVQGMLHAMNAANKNIGAICAAPYALHKAGVLKQNFTCYPSVEEQITLDGYQGDKSMVVEDGNIMTSRGPATAICFALAIVKKLQGVESYEMIKDGLLADLCE
jgi:4-methyl-5(b-hydroxyethyl)-thiazole monophosphate biosynthesis